MAHIAQRVHIHKALEKVQQGQPPPLGLVKGVLEPVAQRGAQGAGAALLGLVGKGRLAGVQAAQKGADLVPRLEPVAQGLADEDGDRQRVALGEPQQRAPVLDLAQAPPLVLGQGAGQLHALLHGHGRQAHAGRQLAQPGPLVAPRGEQEFGPGLAGGAQEIGQLAPLGRAPGRGRPRRETAHRLDVIPDPEHGHLAQHLQGHLPPLAAVQGQPVHAGPFQGRAKGALDGVQDTGQRGIGLERGKEHGAFYAPGPRVPAGELGGGRRLATPGVGV
jgi:hypothetical protein